jgi:hypothetical protein
LRFPLDKGVINVKCSCGHSFIADPDDTELYKDGKFDLTAPPSKNKKLINWNNLCISFMESFYANKYLLQNYKYLAGAEKRKATIILFLCIAISLIAFAGLLALIF